MHLSLRKRYGRLALKNVARGLNSRLFLLVRIRFSMFGLAFLIVALIVQPCCPLRVQKFPFCSAGATTALTSADKLNAVVSYAFDCKTPFLCT